MSDMGGSVSILWACRSHVLTIRRENAVCEYHVHTAVQKGRAGRAEFTARYVESATLSYHDLNR